MNSSMRQLLERIRDGDLQVADLNGADRSRLEELIRQGLVDVVHRGHTRYLVARHASRPTLKGGLS